MGIIKRVIGREVLDSRGNPTVEVEIHTNRVVSRAIVPSGASTGSHEAFELRDNQKRYFGKGVLKAVENIKLLGKHLIGDKINVNEIDKKMLVLDGTQNKSKYGANAILGISLAVAKAVSLENDVPLYKTFGSEIHNKHFTMPTPMFNVINGGMHAGNDLDFQEFMIIPKKMQFKDQLRMGSEIYHELKGILSKKYGKSAVNVGDEGGFAPPLKNIEEPLQLILEAAANLGYKNKIQLGVDVAATQLKAGHGYKIGGKIIESFDMVDFYKDLVKRYPIASIEDPFSEDDWESFYILTKELGHKIMVVGDDLLVTNKTRIKKAITLKSCNTLLLKMNQIGTVSEAVGAGNLAMTHGFKVIVSHRSGETEDTSIADLAVGLGCGHIKAGAPARGERTAKYNQLLRIEEELEK